MALSNWKWFRNISFFFDFVLTRRTCRVRLFFMYGVMVYIPSPSMNEIDRSKIIRVVLICCSMQLVFKRVIYIFLVVAQLPGV